MSTPSPLYTYLIKPLGNLDLCALSKYKNQLIHSHYMRLYECGFNNEQIDTEMRSYLFSVTRITSIPATNSINPST